MIHRIKKRLLNVLRIFKLAKESQSDIALNAFIDNKSILEGRDVILSRTELINCYIGYATYISSKCKLINTSIGKYCSIAPDVSIIVGNHPTHSYVSTHPIFYADRKYAGLSYNIDTSFKEYSIVSGTKDRYAVIGNDVWIGRNAVIINGVSIGDGAIVAASSTVTKDVPPYAIVGGVPAKVIRYRFEKEDIDFLLKLRWWEKDENWIKKHAFLFNNVKYLRKELMSKS